MKAPEVEEIVAADLKARGKSKPSLPCLSQAQVIGGCKTAVFACGDWGRETGRIGEDRKEDWRGEVGKDR